MSDRQGWVCYFDWLPVLEKLAPKDVGELWIALYKYCQTGNPPEFENQSLGLCFQFMKGPVDRDQEKYFRKCDAYRQNAMKRWDSDDAMACDGIQLDANDAKRTTELNRFELNRTKEIRQANKSPRVFDLLKEYAGNDMDLLEALKGFSEMRAKKKKPLTPRSATMLLNKLDELSGGDSGKKVKILDESVLNSWTGVFPLKDDGGSDKAAGHILLGTKLIGGKEIEVYSDDYELSTEPFDGQEMPPYAPLCKLVRCPLCGRPAAVFDPVGGSIIARRGDLTTYRKVLSDYIELVDCPSCFKRFQLHFKNGTLQTK